MDLDFLVYVDLDFQILFFVIIEILIFEFSGSNKVFSFLLIFCLFKHSVFCSTIFLCKVRNERKKKRKKKKEKNQKNKEIKKRNKERKEIRLFFFKSKEKEYNLNILLMNNIIINIILYILL